MNVAIAVFAIFNQSFDIYTYILFHYYYHFKSCK